MSAILAPAELVDTASSEPSRAPPPPDRACCSGTIGPILLLSAIGIILLVGGDFSFYFLFSRPGPVATLKPIESDPVIALTPKKIEIEPEKKATPPDKSPEPAPPTPAEQKPLKEEPPAQLPPKPPPPKEASLFSLEPGSAAFGVTQRRVEDAIDRGVRFLKEKQTDSGTWLTGSAGHAVGYAALPGLTLLECKVSPSDRVIVKAAEYVRAHAAGTNDTYDLSLAVLFLDRLGDKSDRTLIQSLTLRLIAGQTTAGGWDYECPPLTAAESAALAKYLKEPSPLALETLPDSVRKLGVLNQSSLAKVVDDNSNTQFALLALWVARRHEVLTEPSLLFAQRRFTTSQNPDGGWGYHIARPSTYTMTCAGLVGLALGHGAEQGKKDASPPDDASMQKGLRVLGRFVGNPSPNAPPPMENLYFLWSVERVAMLYNLRTIGTKDWYTWGAQMLLAHQHKEGNWSAPRYHGSTPVIDTCFGLLFLRRSNLVHDLDLGLIAIPDRK